jgi:hypothetical protein
MIRFAHAVQSSLYPPELTRHGFFHYRVTVTRATFKGRASVIVQDHRTQGHAGLLLVRLR